MVTRDQRRRLTCRESASSRSWSRSASTSRSTRRLVTIKGLKGPCRTPWPRPITVERGSRASSRSSVPTTSATSRALHGLTRTLINDMVVGVTDGYEKRLEIVGVGYQSCPRAIAAGVPGSARATRSRSTRPRGSPSRSTARPVGVQGIDKQLVGEIAAKIRKLRKPEPYKGKGIRYPGEHVRRRSEKQVSDHDGLVVTPRAPAARRATLRRQVRGRKKLFGTTERPRLVVTRSTQAHLRPGRRRPGRQDRRVRLHHGSRPAHLRG